MQLVVISFDKIFNNEAEILNKLFHAGMMRLHLRKPFSDREKVERLLCDIDAAFHPRVVTHQHFDLTRIYALGGIHSPVVREYGVPVSRSCHSLGELGDIGAFQYAFLSPIFDSISKKGYRSAFSETDLTEARNRGLINERVIALGGVCQATIPQAAAYGFGGVAVMGALWSGQPVESEVLQRFEEISKTLLSCAA